MTKSTITLIAFSSLLSILFLLFETGVITSAMFSDAGKYQVRFEVQGHAPDVGMYIIDDDTTEFSFDSTYSKVVFVNDFSRLIFKVHGFNTWTNTSLSINNQLINIGGGKTKKEFTSRITVFKNENNVRTMSEAFPEIIYDDFDSYVGVRDEKSSR